MVEENRPSEGPHPAPSGESRSSHEYGPSTPASSWPPPPEHAPQAPVERTQPLGIGNWQHERPDFDPHQPHATPGYGGSTSYGSTTSYSGYASPPPPTAAPQHPAPGWPPPAGAASMPYAAPTATRPRRRGAGVVVAAGVVALLVGSAAGFGGARLAQSPVAEPGAGTAPSVPGPAPSATASSAPASPLPAAPGQLDTVAVAAAVLPSTVMIRVGRSGAGSLGSGFVLDTAGHVMTNNHVVADAADGQPLTVVMSDGRTTSATLVGRSPSYDLAVIKLRRTSGLKPMPIGRSSQLAVGQPVLAVGAPLGLPGTVTQGIISAKDRPVAVDSDSEADAPTAYINGVQTDTAINPGNSGGPLIDAAARVVGVNSAILTLGQSRGQSGNIGLGFAIPIDQAMTIGKLLISDGKASYPVIGASVGDQGGGVALTAVEGDGPAAKAGLRVDDVVTAIDDKAISSAEELIVAIRTHRPGERVSLAYERGSRRANATVTLGGREG